MSNFLIYKSSAGSGKTFTLVKEYLRLALADASASQTTYRKILALTFTNKAAAEMKERILKGLNELSNNKNELLSKILSEELNLEQSEVCKRATKLATEILHNYGNFSISTIDSFTHSIIRNFAHDLKLPVNFNIELDEKSIVEKCIDLVISKIGSDEAITKLIVEFSKNNIEDQKNWQVDREIKSFADKALKNKSESKLNLLKDFSIADFAGIRNKLQSENKQYEQELAAIGNEFVELIKKNAIKAEDFSYGTKGLPGYFLKLIKSEIDKELKGSHVLKAINENIWYTKTQILSTKNAIDSIISEIHILFNNAEAIMGGYHSTYILRKAILKNLFSLSLINELEKQVSQFKEEENILFISEFNERISDLVLSEPVPFIYEKLGEKYKHFLLDEFQDTSSMQWQNLIPLIDNSLAEGNLNLIVGDGKQSIYRWRGGEAEQFETLPELPLIKDSVNKSFWEENFKRNAEILELTTNYRSKKNIIEFNNSFFSYIREKELTENWKHIYKSVNQIPVKGNDGGFISIDLIDASYDEEVELSNTEKYINENLESGYRYSDIVILVRNNNQGDLIANYLSEKNIPIISSDSLLLNNCNDIKLIINILSFMAEPENAVALSFIVNHLSNYGLINATLKSDYLIECNSGNLKQKFISLLDEAKINFNLKNNLTLPLLEIVIAIIESFRLTRFKSYLNFFIDAIIEYTNRNTNSIPSFLEWWNERGIKLSLIIPDGLNAVRIMTIHKSKGLEFPIVIIPFCSWKINPNESIVWTEAEKELPIAYVRSTKDLQENSSKEFKNEAQKQLLDSINLLYVAFTRAVNHLHICSRTDKQNKASVFKIIEKYILSEGLQIDNGKHFELGEKLNNSRAKTPKENFKIEADLQNWNKVINIKSNSLSEKDNEQRQYGVLIHKLLAEINKREEIRDVINKYSKEGILSGSEAEKIRKELYEIMSTPEIEVFFASDLVSVNEMEILSQHGNVLRPDRIIFNNDSITIIDFKTGKHSDEYFSQLESYANALKELGFKNCRKYLIYLSERKVVEC